MDHIQTVDLGETTWQGCCRRAVPCPWLPQAQGQSGKSLDISLSVSVVYLTPLPNQIKLRQRKHSAQNGSIHSSTGGTLAAVFPVDIPTYIRTFSLAAKA